MQKLIALQQSWTSCISRFDGIPALALRLYLVPVFWSAGMNKWMAFDATVAWFGDPDFGLGLPLPWLMAFLATAAELGGAVLLLLGLATRWATVPLFITMVVAALTVHWPYGWQAIADASAPFANERVLGSVERLERIRELLQAHGDYSWLTESGSVVILNNGIEFAVTYAIMLMALMVLGGGRYVSADDWLARYLKKP